MSRNTEVAEILEEFADLLAAKDVEYKPRSYRRAAENVLDYPVAIEELAADGPDAVGQIEGVGDAIAAKIIEYIETGEIEELAELRAELPVRMDEITAVEGVGPKTVGTLYDALGITTLDELEAAAEAGDIQDVSGFGAKTEENILSNIPFAREASKRELLGHGRPVADELIAYLESSEPIERAETGGSIRRWRPTIGDIDILVATRSPLEAVDQFLAWDRVDQVIEAGEDKASVRARGIRVDVRLVRPADFGSALQYFTGSKDHNVRLRNRAINRGLKMNEYGVFEAEAEMDPEDGERIAGESEESMYAALDLPWMPPELREDRGEIDAAEAGTLPDLLVGDDMRGELHAHTTWSDGKESIGDLVAAADGFGHEYLAICDHASGSGIVESIGLTDADLREQRDVIRRVDSEHDLHVLAGVEANIESDGSISVSDEVLAELDIVVASPHSDLDQDPAIATDRLVAAIEHPAVDIIGHPTGRMINQRPGLDPAIDRVAAAAAEHDTALEVNANPRRLDLGGAMVGAAIEAGASIVINTDAHSPTEFGNMRYGVHTARRGWAEARDVLNTRPVHELTDVLAA